MRDRQVRSFTYEEQLEKHNYIYELLTAVRLHPVFHVNNLTPYSTTFLSHDVPRTTPEGDDDEFEVSHMFVVYIKSLYN
jgi:hypothetical protein